MRSPVLAPVLIALATCAPSPGPVKPPASSPPAPSPPVSPPGTVGTAPVSRDPQPPIASKQPEVTRVHGLERVDDYAWMKKKGTPEIEGYLAAENAYSGWWMERTNELQDTLYKEMLGRVQEVDSTAPYPQRGYEYYARTEAGKQYSIHCRRKLARGAAEQVLVDLNELGKGEKFIGLGAHEVSDDNHLLAYSLDTTGFRQFKLRIKDLRTGALLPEVMERVVTVAWAGDGKTLFYTTEDAAKRSAKLFRHVVGTPPDKDVLVYEEPDERFGVYASRTRSLSYVMVTLASHTTSEQRFVDARTPAAAFRTILPRKPDIEYAAEHRGDSFYIVTNDKGRTKRLVQVPVANPQTGTWRELVPVRPEVMLDDVDVFRDFYVMSERADGLPRLRGVEFRTGKQIAFEMPEQDYNVRASTNAEIDAHEFQFAYTSMVTPPTVMARDMTTGKTRVIKAQQVPTYDASRYETRRLFATARDGAKIPISAAMRKGTQPDGSAPLYLRAYGSYGAAIDSSFLDTKVSYLDRGAIVAWAHIRGGGEYGKPWHDAGRMMNKRNTFTDFIDAADFLVKQGWTTSDRLAINGGSAGGLLMGAVLNLRPELFKAALVEVPFVDVVNTMLDTSLPLTVGEFEEWGNPKDRDAYDYMMSYSPYDNIKAQGYPAILVRSSYNDSQVFYHEPSKWVAKLRARKTDHNPLLLRMEMDPAGHGGRSGRYDRLRDSAYYDAFVMWQLGLTK